MNMKALVNKKKQKQSKQSSTASGLYGKMTSKHAGISCFFL
jgi:hypothetical protein